MAAIVSLPLISSIKKGLEFVEFERLQTRLGVSAQVLASVIDISERTLARRKIEGRLQPAESDRLYRIVRLANRAEEVIGEPESLEWLTQPKRFLQGRTPLAFADTEIGAHEIEQALGRLEHGVFA
jgi:putative toxin-antitoxin system antitoxin component (TIGR02293 family)